MFTPADNRWCDNTLMHRHPRFLALLEATKQHRTAPAALHPGKPNRLTLKNLFSEQVMYSHKALCCPSLYEPLFYKSYIDRLLQRYRMFALCFDVNSAVNCFCFVFRVPHVRFLKNYRVKKNNTFDWWLFLGYLIRLCLCGTQCRALATWGSCR